MEKKMENKIDIDILNKRLRKIENIAETSLRASRCPETIAEVKLYQGSLESALECLKTICEALYVCDDKATGKEVIAIHVKNDYDKDRIKSFIETGVWRT